LDGLYGVLANGNPGRRKRLPNRGSQIKYKLLQELAAKLQQFDATAGADVRIVLIILTAWISATFLQRAIHYVCFHVTRRFDSPNAAKRGEILARVLLYVITLVIALLAGILILIESGDSVAPFLAWQK
jgi:hypothetical protein